MADHAQGVRTGDDQAIDRLMIANRRAEHPFERLRILQGGVFEVDFKRSKSRGKVVPDHLRERREEKLRILTARPSVSVDNPVGELGQHLSKDVFVPPGLPTIVESLVQTIHLRCIPQAQPIAIYEDNPVQDTPVVGTRLAVGLRDVCFQTRRLRIAEPEDISPLSFRAMIHALPLKSMGPEPDNRSCRPQSH